MTSPARWSTAAAVAFSFFALAAPQSASAFCRMTTEGGAQVGDAACVERGAPFEWTNPCLSYAIDGRGSFWMDFAAVQTAIDQAFATWTADYCDGEHPNLVFQPLAPSTCKRAEYNCSGNVNTVAFLGSPDEPGETWKDPCAEDTDFPYDPNAFAVTIVWHNTSTGEILDADMFINDQESSRFNAGGPYANCPDSGCEGDAADLQSIVTHEVGHFIGIGHCNPIDENDPNDPCVQATMYAKAERSSVNKRTLAEDDINAVCTIYPPGGIDLETCDWTPKGGLRLDCENEQDGSPRACTEGACSANGGSSGGCNAAQRPEDAPWGMLLVTLVGLSLWRRRRVAES